MSSKTIDLATPPKCTADFCLIPLATPTASVSEQIAEVQRLLKKSGLKWCILSPGLFMQNIMGQAASIKGDGKIVQPWPKDLPVALIDVRDTGALGARVLREPDKHNGKLYTFSGVTATVPYQPGRSTTALVRRAQAY